MSVPTHRVKHMPFLAALVENHHGDFKRMLDLGCGELGEIWRKRWGNRYEGLDQRETVKAEHYGDACDLSRFKTDSRDVVTAWSVIEHVRRPYRMLEEAKRVSRGTVIFTTDLTQHDKNGDPLHLYSWTPKTMDQLVSTIHPDYNVYPANNMLIGAMYRCKNNEN